MWDLKGRYRLASQDIVCEEFDGEMVILNLSTGHYFALNRSASVLLGGLLQGIAVEALSAVDGARFSAEEASDFFRNLAEHELVISDGSQSPTPVEHATCEAIKLLSEKPSLEVHDDLADLIIADPIHDSDESTGWPVRKTA